MGRGDTGEGTGGGKAAQTAQRLPIRPGSHAHRLLALAGPEATPLGPLAASLDCPLGKTLGEAQYLAAQGYLRVSGRARARGTRQRSNEATCARTPEGERLLALLGPC